MPNAFDFSSWPPTFTDAQRQHLTLLATTYALSHGLTYLPIDPNPPPAPSSSIHAPLSLLPSPFPRHLFEKVLKLQRIYNVLYARIAMDEEFLDKVMGNEDVIRVDDFTRNLWGSWRRIREQGIPEPIQLGVFRSDYLLHSPKDSNEPVSLKQVEFNTISSSFGALSERASAMHRYLLSATNYFHASPYLKAENLPPNSTTSVVVEGLAAAHKHYGVTVARILFVVQPNERNVFDQRWIEYELLERHEVHVVRQTFDGLLTSASISPHRTLSVALQDPSLASSLTTSQSTVEISVIYYRAGYTPKDYPTSAHYALRERLSASRAINCPTLPLQLAGGKKVQQVLTEPGVLERFLQPAPSSSQSTFGPETFTNEDLASLRETWVPMFALSTPPSLARALDQHMSLVLKPQREGGGNNVYHSSIPSFLSTLPAGEGAAWIAMDLIQPPQGVGGYLARAGGGGEAKGAGKAEEVISELGVFGWAIFGGEGSRKRGDVVMEEEGKEGWLVRTKGRESDEGGVAVGFSVLDSVLLVD